MPRPRKPKFDTPSGRLALDIRATAYPAASLQRGTKLMYRRNKGAGGWQLRGTDGHGQYFWKLLGLADDFEPANDDTVLSYPQAILRAQVQIGAGVARETNDRLTVGDALDAYEKDLRARGAAIGNVKRVRRHMTPALAAKPVARLIAKDLLDWRDDLLAAGMRRVTFSRTRSPLRAALERAADADPSIANRQQFKNGLKALPSQKERARRAALTEAEVIRLIQAAYEVDERFGILIEVLAQTGARISQVVDATCDGLNGNRLTFRSSYKGRGGPKKQLNRMLPAALAARLRQLKGNRDAFEPLLLDRELRKWELRSRYRLSYAGLFRQAVKLAGLDPKITSYALRHSSICRALNAGTNATLVAQLHDTSQAIIEKHYAAYIRDVTADEVEQRSLLSMPGDNVVMMQRSA